MTLPRSMLDTLATLVAGSGGASLAVSGLLARTERLGARELERHQLWRAARLLAHARTTVPFYSHLPALSASEVTMDRFRELPVLSRESVRERAAELVSRSIPEDHRIVGEVSSSGSTGRHVTVALDAVSAAMGDALALRDHAWHGRDPTQKAAAIRAVVAGADAPEGRREPSWSPHPKSGPLTLLDIHTPVREQVAFLVREAPAYLATYPTNAEALVLQMERERVRLPDLRELGTFGEVLPPGLREACRRVLGVPLVDAYSAVELGFIALECPEHEHYHVQAEHVLVEVLRSDGSPCAAGETGRVVVTALHAFAMPLIRYELGDYAVVGRPCACGRSLPVLDRILGRARNMIHLPSGDRIWPRFGSNVIGRLFPLRQFRLVQKGVQRLSLDIVAERPLDAGEEQGLRDLVLTTLRHPFELELRYVDSIPRSPGGKFEDVLCELEPMASTVRSGC